MAEQLALGEAIIAIRAVGDQLQRDIQGIGAGVERQLSPLRQKLQQLGNFGLQAGRLLATGIGAAAGAATAAATAVGALTLRVAANADEQTKLSQKLGIAIESLGGWKLAAELAGASSQEFTVGLRTIAQRAQDAQSGLAEAERSFESLGVKVTGADGKLRDIEGIVLDVADRFVDLEDGTEKAALAQELFGRGGAALIPLLNQGSDAIRAQIEEADELGLTFDLKTGKAAERLNDTILRLKSAGTGLLNEAITPLIPELADVAESTLGWVRENRALIAQNIKAVIDGIVSSVKFLAPFVEAAAVSFSGFATSVGDFAESVRSSRLVQILGDLREAAQAISTLAPIAFAFRDGDPRALGRAISGAIDDIRESITDANEEAEDFTDTLGDRGRSGTMVGALDAATDAVADLGGEIEPTAQEVEDADVAFENLMRALDEFEISAKDSEEAAGDLHEEVGNSEQVTRTALNDWRGFSEELTTIFGSLSGSFSRDFSQAIIAMDFDDLGSSLFSSLERMFGRVVERLLEAAIFDPLFEYLVGGLTGAGGGLLGGVGQSVVGGAASSILGPVFDVLGSAAGAVFGTEFIAGASSILGGAGVTSIGTAIADIGAASAAGASSVGLETGSILGASFGTAASAAMVIAGAAVLEAFTGVFTDLYGSGTPTVEEKQAASIAKKLGKVFKSGEFASQLDAALQPFGVTLSGSLAKSIIQTPALFREDVRELIERNLSGESFGDIRAALPSLSLFADPTRTSIDIDGLGDVSLGLPGLTNTDALVDDLKDIPVEEFLKVAFGLDVIDEIGAEAAGKVADQVQLIGETVAAEQGLTGRRARQFADSMARGLLVMAEQAGITADELIPFFDMLIANTGADAVARMNEWGDQVNDIFKIDEDGLDEGQDRIQSWLDDLARNVAQVSDVNLEKLLNADDLGELFRLSGLSAEEFVRQIERIAEQDPRLRAFIDAMDPPLIDVLTGAADEAERLRDAVAEVFASADQDIGGSLENLQDFVFNDQGELRTDNLRERINAINEEIRRVSAEGGDVSQLIINRDKLEDELRAAEADYKRFNQTVISNFQAMWQAINADGEVTKEEAAGFIALWRKTLDESGDAISDSTRDSMEDFFSWMREEWGLSEDQILELFTPEEIAELMKTGALAAKEAVDEVVDGNGDVEESQDDVKGATEDSTDALGDMEEAGKDAGETITKGFRDLVIPALTDTKSLYEDIRDLARELIEMGIDPSLYLGEGGFTVPPPPGDGGGGGGDGGGGGGVGTNSFAGNPAGRILIEADPATYARMMTGPVLVEMRELGRRGDLSIDGRRVTLHESLG